MNWVEELATIDCLIVDVSDPMEELKEVTKNEGSTDDVVETPIEVETLEKMLEVFKADEATKEEDNELKQWLQLCYLVDLKLEEETKKEEVNSQHNVPNGIPRKIRKANIKGVITEKMNEKALEEKQKEEASNDLIPLRDVQNYFKDYIIDEVVIVVTQNLRSDPNKGEILEDGVFDGPAKTKEINLANEEEPNKPMFIGTLDRRRE